MLAGRVPSGDWATPSRPGGGSRGGTVAAVSLWDTAEHSRVLREALLALDIALDPIEVYEVLDPEGPTA